MKELMPMFLLSAGDVFAGLLVLALIFFAIRSTKKQKASGGCAGCPHAGKCSSENDSCPGK